MSLGAKTERYEVSVDSLTPQEMSWQRRWEVEMQPWEKIEGYKRTLQQWRGKTRYQRSNIKSLRLRTLQQWQGKTRYQRSNIKSLRLSLGSVFLAQVHYSHAWTMRTWPENNTLRTRSYTTFHLGSQEQHFTKWWKHLKRMGKLDANWLLNILL